MNNPEEKFPEQFLKDILEFGDPNEIDRVNCAKFEQILKKLKERRKIIDWRKTEKDLEDDQKGIDWFLETAEDTVPYSITSTYRLWQMHIQKHPNIPCTYLRQPKKPSFRPDEVLINDVINGISFYKHVLRFR